MSLRERITKEFTLYSASFIFTQVINVALALFIRNVLGPEQMGAWIALQVILTYTKYSNMGLAEAAGREIPFERGRGHSERINDIRNASYTFTLLVAVVLSVGMAIAAFFVYRSFGMLYGVSLLTLAFLSFFQRVSTFCIVMVRAERRFDFINRFNVYTSAANAVLVVLLVHFFQLYGYYAAMVLSFVFNYFYLIGFSGVPFRLRWNWLLLTSLFKMGIVLVFVSLSHTFFTSVDKLSITATLGVKALGIYSITMLVSNLILIFPNNLSVIIFPYLNEAYGESREPEKLRKFVLLPNEFIACYLPILIGLLSIGSPYLIRIFLPKYVEGLSALKIGLWTSVFLILASNMGNSLITLKKYAWMIPLQLVLGFATWGINWLLIRQKFGLPAIAATDLVAHILLWASYLAVFFRTLPSPALLRSHVSRLLMTIGYASIMSVLLDFCVPQKTFTMLIVKLVLWTVISVPVLLFGERMFETYRLFKGLVSKIKKLPEIPPVTNPASL